MSITTMSADWDGDLNAIRIISVIWGDDVARTIKRKRGFCDIEKLFGSNNG